MRGKHSNLKEIGVVYKIINKINNKIYIGKTFQDINTRFRQHYFVNESTLIHKAMVKYGIDNFSLDILYSSIDEEEINEKEIFYIEYYNARDKNIGYNICKGGEGTKGRIVSKEFKNYMSNIMGDKVQNLNTGEVYKNMYEAERQINGRVTAGLNSAIRSKRRYKNYWWIKLPNDTPLTEEERKVKIEELESNLKRRVERGAYLRSIINKNNPPLSVPVICIETQEIFKTKLEANLKYNCYIETSLNNINKTAAGYHWCKIEDKERRILLESKYKNKGKEIKKRYFTKPFKCLDTGEEFYCLEDFKSKYPNYYLGLIQACARGETKTSYNKHWQYIEK